MEFRLVRRCYGEADKKRFNVMNLLQYRPFYIQFGGANGGWWVVDPNAPWIQDFFPPDCGIYYPIELPGTAAADRRRGGRGGAHQRFVSPHSDLLEALGP